MLRSQVSSCSPKIHSLLLVEEDFIWSACRSSVENTSAIYRSCEPSWSHKMLWPAASGTWYVPWIRHLASLGSKRGSHSSTQLPFLKVPGAHICWIVLISDTLQWWMAVGPGWLLEFRGAVCLSMFHNARILLPWEKDVSTACCALTHFPPMKQHRNSCLSPIIGTVMSFPHKCLTLL